MVVVQGGGLHRRSAATAAAISDAGDLYLAGFRLAEPATVDGEFSALPGSCRAAAAAHAEMANDGISAEYRLSRF